MKFKIKSEFTRSPKNGLGLLGKRGFTLVEMLVVIAIVGLLASIFVRYLEGAKSRGENSAIKNNLHNARSQMNVSYATNADSFSDLCTSDSKLVSIMRDASLRGVGNTTSYVCNSNATTWAISSPLRILEGSNSHWCVDSTGNAKGEVANLSAGVYRCP